MTGFRTRSLSAAAIGELGKDIRERYSKHVRAIFQVGDKLTDDYKLPLGYPVEIIPQQNPYALKAGQTLTVLCTRDGQPLAQSIRNGGMGVSSQASCIQ